MHTHTTHRSNGTILQIDINTAPRKIINENMKNNEIDNRSSISWKKRIPHNPPKKTPVSTIGTAIPMERMLMAPIMNMKSRASNIPDTTAHRIAYG